MKKALILLLWFSFTPALLVASLASAYFTFTRPRIIPLNPAILALQNHQVLGPTDPSQVKGINTTIQAEDARPVILAEFLRVNGSPLDPQHYGQVLTDIADRYDLDFRLLPSIMMQESNLCKKIPDSSHNCLGLGIHSQGTWEFDTYEANFEAAAKVLRNNYLNKGYITPDEIQDKYTPGSNGSWEFAVNHFMDILETAEF